MAKSKNKPKTKKVLDEEEEIQEEAAPEEEAEAIDEEAAEAVDDDADAEDADADEPLADDDEPAAEDDEPVADDEDEPQAEDDEAPADSADPDDEGSIDEPVGPPPARITKWAIALILLNWIAAPTFLTFAYLDHVKRSYYSYRTMVNHAQVWGLPLRSEDEFASISNYTRPVQKYSPDQLKDAFKKRNTGAQGVTEPFVAVEEEVPLRLRPRDMTDAVQRDLFWDLPNPVATLEDEIDRLKTALPEAIKAAAKEVADKVAKMKDDEKRKFVEDKLTMPGDPAAVDKMKKDIAAAAGADLDNYVKRAYVQRTLFPLAWEPVKQTKDEIAFNIRSILRVKKLDDDVNAAKGKALDDLLDEAVQRRLYYDILAPIDAFRPADIGPDEAVDRRRFRVDRIADRAFKLKEIEDHLQARLTAAIADHYDPKLHIGDVWKNAASGDATKRDAIEKRKVVAFILFTISQVQRPLLDKRLVEKGMERAQVVSGLHEFTGASVEYVRAVRTLEERVVEAARVDRQGWIISVKDAKDPMKNVDSRSPGFIDEFEQEIDRLVKLVEQIDIAEGRRDQMKKERDRSLKIYEERAQQHKAAIDRLLKARVKTDELVIELREKQAQLHEALKELSDAGERNFEIEAEIRAIELRFFPKTKGGKKP